MFKARQVAHAYFIMNSLYSCRNLMSDKRWAPYTPYSPMSNYCPAVEEKEQTEDKEKQFEKHRQRGDKSSRTHREWRVSARSAPRRSPPTASGAAVESTALEALSQAA